MNDPYAPTSGGIPYTVGMPSLFRIPVPGTNGLCIEFRPRGYVPPGGSTSTLFFQDISGKRHLRLDYGYNIKTKTIDFHWNQTGTHSHFGISDHATAGPMGSTIHKAAEYFWYAGRTLIVIGASVDMVSIVKSDRPLRQATAVVAAWALAWIGCKNTGAGGAALGSLASPIGTAVGGIGGCIVGGYAGYNTGSLIGGTVYDWAQMSFSSIPEIAAQ